MSARSVSLASRVFFDGEARRLEQPRQRRVMHRHAMFSSKPLCQLGQGQLTIGIDPANHYVPINRQLAATRRPSLPRRGQRPCLRFALCKTNRRRRTHTKPPRRCPTRTTLGNRSINTAPKIRRMCSTHDPPPKRVNHKSARAGILRFRLSAERSSSLLKNR
jgi:hypothetical protein